MENKTYELSPIGQQEKRFELAMRTAKAYNASTMVPMNYRGQENLGNCVIACDMAARMGVSPMAVMQNMAVVQGRPSWSGQALISFVNATGKFTPLRFEEVGEPMKQGWKVRAWAYELNPDGSHGQKLESDWITTDMVNQEGWSKKNGSKWLTMPRQMARYRAGAFFQRVYAPELAMGCLTQEEAEDIAPRPAVVDGGYAEEVKVSFAAPQPQEKPQPEPQPTAAPKMAQNAPKAANPGNKVQSPEDLFK